MNARFAGWAGAFLVSSLVWILIGWVSNWAISTVFGLGGPK